MAPADSTTMSPVKACGDPSGSVTAAPVADRPLLSVVSRSTVVLVIRVRLGCAARAGRITAHSASALAATRQGNPSTRSHRMQAQLRQVIAELLDTGLVLHGRVRVIPARPPREVVLAVPTVHPE